MAQEKTLCPFSKPIIGNWCQCQHARLMDRCSGKMVCTRADDLKIKCLELDSAFKTKMRFLLGITGEQGELTHAQLMKIRCGGFMGMQKVFKLETPQPPDVRVLIERTLKDFQSIEDFPYNEIVQEIKNFKHRK